MSKQAEPRSGWTAGQSAVVAACLVALVLGGFALSAMTRARSNLPVFPWTHPSPTPQASPSASSGTTSPGPSASSLGTVTGYLYVVGGLSPGQPSPVRGTVTLTDLTLMGPTVSVGPGGAFSIDVAPGQYLLRGGSPSYGGGKLACQAKAPVRVKAGETVITDVFCQER